jgi:hypothetical protein
MVESSINGYGWFGRSNYNTPARIPLLDGDESDGRRNLIMR